MNAVSRSPWAFYGRRQELATLQEILRRHSDPAGVVSAARDFFDLFGIETPPPPDLRSLAAAIRGLVRRGFIVALDEFQYFHRKVLYPFNSHLQYEVDQLSRDAADIQGDLRVLGSIHTEMAALLEDRSAPLFARLTDALDLQHLDVAPIVEILRAHAEPTAERLLFLWNLFEGVPKFYRDAYEEDVLGADGNDLCARAVQEIADDLRSALAQIEDVFMDLEQRVDVGASADE